MSAADTGEPAFPVATIDGYTQVGMTLRDYFAAKAMAAFIAEPVEGVKDSCGFEIDHRVAAQFSASAYVIADAMLKARAA